MIVMHLDVDPSMGAKNSKYTIHRSFLPGPGRRRGRARIGTSDKYREFVTEVGLQAKSMMNRMGWKTIAGDLALGLVIIWPATKKDGTPRKRADVDASETAILDGLQAGDVFANDSQIEFKATRIRSATPGSKWRHERPGVVVAVIRSEDHARVLSLIGWEESHG